MAEQLTIQCPVCGFANPIEEEDRGGQIFCASHGGPIDIPVNEPSTVQAPPPNRAAPSRAKAGNGLWCVDVTPRTGGALALRNCPISDGQGRLVAALQDVVVYLAEEGTGVRVVWEYPTGGFISGSPAAAADGTLRVHSNDGRLHGLSPDGQPLWPPVDVGESLNWSSPLVDSEGTTWLCGYSGGLIKVDASGKKSPKPYFRSPNKFDCAGVLHGGMLVVGSEDQFVHAINLRGVLGSEVWDQGANHGRTNWFINSAIALASGPTFVVASRDEHLYGFSPDGSEVWKTKVPGQVLGSPVVDADDRVFIGVCRGDRGSTPQGALACFDIRRRQWLWEAPAQGPVESTPVVGSDGTVYVGDNAGFVQAVSASGKLLWQVCVGQPVRSAGTIVSSGHVVFGDDAGRLFALQCDSTGLAGGWPKSLGVAVWAAPSTAPVAGGRPAEETRTTIRIPFDCSSAPSTSQDWKPPQPEPEPVPRPPVVEQPTRPPVPPQTTATTTVTGDRRASELPSRPVSEVAGVRETVGVKQAVGVPGSSADGLPTGVTTSRELPAVEQSVITTSPTTTSSPIFSQPPVVEVVPPPIAVLQPLPGRLVSVADYGTGSDLLPVRFYPWRLPRTGQPEQRVLYLTNGGLGDLFVTTQCIGRGVTASPAGCLRIPPGRQKFVVLNLEPTADEWLLVNFQTPDSRPGKRLTVRIQR
ncbi:MAG: PQQ-binding-like beta-propeller repeat protein [Planctomycetales bacterium]|nr:PQQ-binding-like beta-propeller repeat protein [Planctomycetales bacterium]